MISYLNRNAYIIIVITFILLFSLKLYGLDADPDKSLSDSNGLTSDEGYHAANAIKKYLTGSWINSHIMYNKMPLITVHSFTQYIMYNIFGINLVSARIPSVILTILTSLLMSILIYYRFKTSTYVYLFVLSFLALVGTNSFINTYSRTALIDLSAYGIGFLGTFIIIYTMMNNLTSSKKIILLIIAGIIFSLSVKTKTIGLLFPMGIFFYILLKMIIERKVKDIIDYKIIILPIITFVVFYLMFDIWSRYEFGHIYYDSWKYEVGNKITYDFYKNYINPISNKMVIESPGLIIVGVVGIIICLVSSAHNHKLDIIDGMMISLFVCHYLIVGSSSYQPLRYFLGIVFPLMYFVFISLQEFIEWSGNKKSIIVGLFLLMHLNYFHFKTTINYYSDLKYAQKNTASKIDKFWNEAPSQFELYTAGGRLRQIIYGDQSAMFALLGINKKDIGYQVPKKNKSGYYFAQFEANDRGAPNGALRATVLRLPWPGSFLLLSHTCSTNQCKRK